MRYVVNPRGVLSHHVLQRAFCDALYRRENVRHATLLFCALERRVFVKVRRRRIGGINGKDMQQRRKDFGRCDRR